MSAPSALGPPPTGGDVNHGAALNGIVWAFAGLSTLILCLRYYTRWSLTRNLGWDDAIMGFSIMLLYIQSSMVSVAISYGLARHQYYLPLSHVSNVVKWQLLSEPFAIFGTTVPKIAITMLLVKIMGPSKHGVIWLWSLNILLNAISIVCLITAFVQCTPVSAYWTHMGTCWAPQIVANLAITQGAISSFTDFALALFPVPIIWNLQMALGKKIAVCLLMGLGCFAGISAIIRTTKLAKLTAQSDYPWETWTLVLWVAIETNIIIICACIPSLRPLFRTWLGKSLDSTRRSYQNKYKGGSDSGYMLEPGSLQSRKGQVVRIVGPEGLEVSHTGFGRNGIRTTTDIYTTSEPEV